MFIVLEKGCIVSWLFLIITGNVTKTKDDHVIAHALVADATASVSLSLWDTDAEWLQPGDIIRLKGAYVLIMYFTIDPKLVIVRCSKIV